MVLCQGGGPYGCAGGLAAAGCMLVAVGTGGAKNSVV